jgi:hypothetical protein
MCVGKKTALLQTLVAGRLVWFANVLFCASDIHFAAKLPLSSFFFGLLLTFCGMSSGGFAAHVPIHRCEANAY